MKLTILAVIILAIEMVELPVLRHQKTINQELREKIELIDKRLNTRNLRAPINTYYRITGPVKYRLNDKDTTTPGVIVFNITHDHKTTTTKESYQTIIHNCTFFGEGIDPQKF